MEAVVGLIIPFIAIAIVAKGTDVIAYLCQILLAKIPGLPDQIEPTLAFIIVFGINFLILYLGNFDLFFYLLFDWDYPVLGNIVTALFVSAGSKLLRESFGLINEIPISINSATTVVKQVLKNKLDKNIEEVNYYNDYQYNKIDDDIIIDEKNYLEEIGDYDKDRYKEI